AEDQGIAHQIGNKVIEVVHFRGKQPTSVSMPETDDEVLHAGALQVRRVRVALTVAEGVMTPVYCCPIQQRPLRRHRAHDRQHDLYGSSRLEGTMGKQAMKADSNANDAHNVHTCEQPDFWRSHAGTPQLNNRGEQCEEWHDHDYDGDAAFAC